MTLEGAGLHRTPEGRDKGTLELQKSPAPALFNMADPTSQKKKKTAETAETAATQTPTSLSASRSLQDDAAPRRVAPAKSRLSTTPLNLAWYLVNPRDLTFALSPPP